MKFKNKTYDILKWIVIVVLPAIQVFWIAIATAWALPFIAPIAETIAAVTVLLGTIIGVSSVKYKKENK